MTAEYRCLYGISSSIPGYNPGCSDDTVAKDVSTTVATSKGKIFWFLFGRLSKVYKHDEIPRYGQVEAAEFAQQHSKLPVRGGITMGDLWSRRQNVTLVPLEEADYAHWSAGRFVVIGDGAHKMTPQTGSGGMLAIQHAAALANLLHNLDSIRLDKEPITTSQVETALSHFDTKSRHVRTTATIQEAGSLTRLQAFRTIADRLLVYLLFPRAGDARADQLCGDAVGAERIEYLPLPKRSLIGTMPFNPEHGIGWHESLLKRALWASPLLILGLAGFISIASVAPLEGAAQILATGLYRWKEDGTEHEVYIPKRFYKIPIVNEFSRPGVMRFIVSRAFFRLQNVCLFADYGVWYAIMLIESSRRSLQLTLLQW